MGFFKLRNGKNEKVEKNRMPASIEKPEIPPYNSPTKTSVVHKTVYKRTVDKKLTIVLVENTAEVAKEKDTLIKIVKSLGPSGLVSIINYGSAVRQSEIFELSEFDEVNLLCTEDIGDRACLYDALKKLENLVYKEYMHIEEKEKERIIIKEIEVIGIGTGKDNCSKVTKDSGIDSFCRIARKPKVTTKYFCLTEDTFINVAEIGFRSIGAIFRNY